MTGQGVKRDEGECFKWYLKGAEAGDTLAVLGVDICYRLCWGVKKDEVGAAKWLKKWQDAGNEFLLN
jgi:TPR repeat protein